MTPNEYQKLAMRTNDGCNIGRLKAACQIDVPDFGQPNDSRIPFADLVLGSMGLAGESGEVADIVKKAIFHGHWLDSTELKKELGDVLWYIALICDAMKFSLEEIMQLNIEKLKARYPDGFSEKASINRSE